MNQEDQKLISTALDTVFGGLFTTIFSASMGRLMWHAREVRQGRRKFLSVEILWDVPIAIGMAIVAEGIGAYFEFSRPITSALVAVCAYLGPRGFEVWAERILSGREK